MKKLAALLLVPMLCACQGRVALLPALPPPPADISRPVGPEMLPDLKCLQETAQPCRGNGSSPEPRPQT